MVNRQNEILNTKNNEFNTVAILPLCVVCCLCLANAPGNVKIDFST